jgi:hypothetical protein
MRVKVILKALSSVQSVEPGRSMSINRSRRTRRSSSKRTLVLHKYPFCALDRPVDPRSPFVRNSNNFYLCTPRVHSFGLLCKRCP